MRQRDQIENMIGTTIQVQIFNELDLKEAAYLFHYIDDQLYYKLFDEMYIQIKDKIFNNYWVTPK